MEAGTVEEEKKVAEELEADPDLLENYFALQMEVEELRRNEDCLYLNPKVNRK